MTIVIKLFRCIIKCFQRKSVENCIRDLPASVRKDIGLPTDPDPPRRPFPYDHF